MVCDHLFCIIASIALVNEGYLYRIIRSGLALISKGQVAEGIDQIQQGLQAYHIAGATPCTAYPLLSLAERYGKSDKPPWG